MQYAKINSDGTLDSWSATTSFPNARLRPTSVVHNGILYIIGGWSGWSANTLYNDVQYAEINSDGTIGSWSTGTTFFPQVDLVI